MTKTMTSNKPPNTVWTSPGIRPPGAPIPVPDSPPAPAPNAGSPSFEEASRFLCQAGFGGNAADIDNVRRLGLEGWFFDQLDKPRRSNIDRFRTGPATRQSVFPIFWENAIYGDDQLRQRAAYALSQITVVSLAEHASTADVFAAYTDILADEAFGTYSSLIRRSTYAPAMGLYLSHLGNEKADPARGSAPDENYARELLQLFTIGLVELDDGGEERGGETFGLDDVEGLAAILTGLSWSDQNTFTTRAPPAGDPRRLAPMDGYRSAHEPGAKRFLGKTFEGDDPVRTIDQALNHLLAHPNVAPFVGRQLVQRLVTSNPSPAYVRRVSGAFNAGRFAMPSGRVAGRGERGDMIAVLAAVLFDREARSARRLDDPDFGRLREPTLRFAHYLRAFRAGWSFDTPMQSAGRPGYSHQPHVFGEQPWFAPNVFGSFPPDYAVPQTRTAQRGLVAPELRAMNEATSNGYVMFLVTVTEREGEGVYRVLMDRLRRASDEPARLIDLIDDGLFHGAMRSATKATLDEAMALINRPRNLDLQRKHRTALALLLAMTTPEFAVQR